mgnify:CR=1 FL=1
MQPDEKENNISAGTRRQFIGRSLLLAGSWGLGSSLTGSGLAAFSRGTYTVQQVIDLILRSVPGAPFPDTVDTLKAGRPGQPVTGIVTTMFPTIEVIRKSHARGANFIIAHEPSFYNHTDDVNWVPGNKVVESKRALLEETQTCIWRFHDYWHSVKPAGITYGVVKSAGWLPYFSGDKALLEIPALSLADLATHLKRSLQIEKVRVIGSPDHSCSRLALMPGAWGGQRQIEIVEQQQPDVLIVGEVNEWETAEYIRDRRALGMPAALIILGHVQSEEPGMEWLVSWLSAQIKDLPISHIPSGDPFTWM